MVFEGVLRLFESVLRLFESANFDRFRTISYRDSTSYDVVRISSLTIDLITSELVRIRNHSLS